MNDDPLFTSLWAWMTFANDEWVLVGALVGGFHVPLVFALERIARSDTVRELAHRHRETTGQPTKLVRYDAVGFEP